VLGINQTRLEAKSAPQTSILNGRAALVTLWSLGGSRPSKRKARSKEKMYQVVTKSHNTSVAYHIPLDYERVKQAPYITVVNNLLTLIILPTVLLTVSQNPVLDYYCTEIYLEHEDPKFPYQSELL